MVFAAVGPALRSRLLQTGFVKLYENGDTRSYRAGMHPDIESAGVMMEIGFDPDFSGTGRDWDDQVEWNGRDQPTDKHDDLFFEYRGPLEAYHYGETIPDTFPMEVRLFPDEGAGLEDIQVHYTSADSFLWTDFAYAHRLKVWGTAKETKDDPGVRLPEVRLIFRWETHDRNPTRYARLLSGADGLSGLEGTVTHYLDIPLWRTSNVMNKLNRCSDNLLTDR